MQRIAAHLDRCPGLRLRMDSVTADPSSLAALGPVQAPPDLLLRIRVAVSQERARSHQSPFLVWNLAWKNTVGPFLLQAAAGFRPAPCFCWDGDVM